MKNLRYLVLGTIFGIVLCKVQAVSWWRMQEMFRFDAFYMYGIFATAIPTGMLSIWLIKKFNIKTASYIPMSLPMRLEKQPGK